MVVLVPRGTVAGLRPCPSGSRPGRERQAVQPTGDDVGERPAARFGGLELTERADRDARDPVQVPAVEQLREASVDLSEPGAVVVLQQQDGAVEVGQRPAHRAADAVEVPSEEGAGDRLAGGEASGVLPRVAAHHDRLDLHQRPAEVLGAAGVAEVVVPVQQRPVESARHPGAMERQMQVRDVAEPDQRLGVRPRRLDVQLTGDPIGPLSLPRLGRRGQVGHDQPQLPIEDRTRDSACGVPQRTTEGGIAIDGPDLDGAPRSSAAPRQRVRAS